MTNKRASTSAPDSSNGAYRLPAPAITVLPTKAGLPADGGPVDLLVNLSVELPAVEVDRKPLNLALVIDRSGSMSGDPLVGAKLAAQTAVGMLMPGDWVSVVQFDSEVEVVQPLVRVGEDRRSIIRAIEQIHVRGSTNLFGGWAEGLSQVMACPDNDVVSRVVLLSDGMTNHGVTDPATISRDVAEGAKHGVTTTAMGLGRDYDEHLMRLIADAGHGNYVFLSDHSVMVTAFETEVAGLSALRGKNLELVVTPASAGTLAFAVPSVALAAGLTSTHGSVTLPNLVAGLPLDLLLTLTAAAGAERVGLTLVWDDVLTGRRESLEHTLDLPRLTKNDWEAAPVNVKVSQERLLLELAATKQRVAAAARSHDLETAKLEVNSVEAAVAAMPAGAERQREESELEELRKQLTARDHAMMARHSDQFAMRRAHGVSDVKLAAMFKSEQELRMKKRAMGPWAPPIGEVLLDFQAGRARGSTTIQVVRGSIEQQSVDAVVNSASRSLMHAAGVSAALANAGGPGLQRAMQEAPQLQFGEAVFTRGFDLPAQFVIHTAAQPYVDDGSALNGLKLCYSSVFQLAQRLGAKSIALPAIGTGHYQVPAAVAALAAVEVTRAWTHKVGEFETIRFVVIDEPVAQAFVQAFQALRHV